MLCSARAWGLVAAIGSAIGCTPDTSGLGGGDSAVPVDPSSTGTTAGTTGTSDAPMGSTTSVTDPDGDTVAATTTTGDPLTTEGSTASSVDTADTETPPTVIERCNQDDLAIPEDDDIGVASGIEIAEDGTIVELRVVIRATHPFVGDLAFELRKGEAALMVIDNPGGALCSGDDVDVVLRDDAVDTIDAACLVSGSPALAGDVQPESPLAPVFGGLSTAGTWRLRAIDNQPPDIGTLTEWCLQIAYQ